MKNLEVHYLSIPYRGRLKPQGLPECYHFDSLDSLKCSPLAELGGVYVLRAVAEGYLFNGVYFSQDEVLYVGLATKFDKRLMSQHSAVKSLKAEGIPYSVDIYPIKDKPSDQIATFKREAIETFLTLDSAPVLLDTANRVCHKKTKAPKAPEQPLKLNHPLAKPKTKRGLFDQAHISLRAILSKLLHNLPENPTPRNKLLCVTPRVSMDYYCLGGLFYFQFNGGDWEAVEFNPDDKKSVKQAYQAVSDYALLELNLSFAQETVTPYTLKVSEALEYFSPLFAYSAITLAEVKGFVNSPSLIVGSVDMHNTEVNADGGYSHQGVSVSFTLTETQEGPNILEVSMESQQSGIPMQFTLIPLDKAVLVYAKLMSFVLDGFRGEPEKFSDLAAECLWLSVGASAVAPYQRPKPGQMVKPGQLVRMPKDPTKTASIVNSPFVD